MARDDAKARFAIEGDDRSGAAVNSATRRLSQLGRAASRTTAAGLIAGGGALLRFGRNALETADDLQKMRDAGFGTMSQLSLMRDVVTENAGTFREFEKSLLTQSDALFRASQGGGSQLDMLREMGVETAGMVVELNRLTPFEAYLRIGDAINGIENVNTRIAVARQLWGRAAATNIRIFQNGKEGVLAQMEAARARGRELSDEAGDAAAGAQDAMARLQGQFESIAEIAATRAAPAIDNFANALVGLNQAGTGADGRSTIERFVDGVGSAVGIAGRLVGGAAANVGALASGGLEEMMRTNAFAMDDIAREVRNFGDPEGLAKEIRESNKKLAIIANNSTKNTVAVAQ